MMSSVRRGIGVAALAAIVGAAAAPALAQDREGAFERTLQVTGPVTLIARSGSGRIRVSLGPTDTVRISARIRAGRFWFSGDAAERIREIERNPPIEQSGNSIQVGRQTDDRLFRNISIRYDIAVPSQATVDARTGSGSVDIGDVQGAVQAHTGSGSIVIGRTAAAVVARTGSGSVNVRGAQGLDARCGSGSIDASGISGAVTAHSGSGGVKVAHVGPGDLDVSSSSGHVSVTGVDGAARISSSSGGVDVEGRPSGRWDIHSPSGSIVLHVPNDAAFELDARVSSGGIDVSHPLTPSGRIDRRHVQGQVRGGGPLVAVRSSSGGIRIE